MRNLLALLLSAILLAPAHAAELGSVDGIRRESITVQIAPGGGPSLRLEALVTRPAGPGRYPLVLLSHGTPRVPEDRKKSSPATNSAVAIEFAQRGWAVVSVMRRGYGQSEGEYSESNGSCGPSTTNYLAAGRGSAQDLTEALKTLARAPYVDASRVLLVGVSAGGFASLAAAAERPPGLVAVLNFAGGRGSTAPDTVCLPERLVEAFGRYGRGVQVPTLWLYAENDHFFGPDLARRFLAAFRENGGKAEFVKLPAFGEDGHFLFGAQGIGLWREPVDRFLNANRLPTWERPVRPRLPDLPPAPGWTGRNLEEFDRYRASVGFEKALAIGKDGRWVWRSGLRTPEEAAKAVLERCEETSSGCRVYAINNRLAR